MIPRVLKAVCAIAFCAILLPHLGVLYEDIRFWVLLVSALILAVF